MIAQMTLGMLTAILNHTPDGVQLPNLWAICSLPPTHPGLTFAMLFGTRDAWHLRRECVGALGQSFGGEPMTLESPLWFEALTNGKTLGTAVVPLMFDPEDFGALNGEVGGLSVEIREADARVLLQGSTLGVHLFKNQP